MTPKGEKIIRKDMLTSRENYKKVNYRVIDGICVCVHKGMLRYLC